MPERKSTQGHKPAKNSKSPMRRVVAALRNAWRILTQMRTAMILLMMLAIAAIPGALLPQRQLSATNVNSYLADNPTLGKLFDALQLFDVFSSWWFTAIYVLLFVSLVGCLTPRTIELMRQLRTEPPRAPGRFARLPHNATLSVPREARVSQHDAAEAVTKHLRGWRVRRNDGDGRVAGATELSAERGYLREVGNLAFHFGMLGVLVAMALGKLYHYEGMVIQIAEPDAPAYCNTTPAAFDSFRAGAMVDGTDLKGFCFQARSFTADYLPTGQASMFTSDIKYSKDVTASDPAGWQDYQLRVNEPLRINGNRLYLQGHGFAPTFTVTWPNGESRTDTLQWVPSDQVTFLSSGAMRFDPPAGMFPDFQERLENGIAIQGLLAPTAAFDDTGTILSSSFPAPRDPAVAIDVYRGDTGLETNRVSSLFALDQGLIDEGALKREARVNLRVGESTTLPDGTTVRFDGVKEFANYQISYDPGQQWVAVSAVVMMVGLLVSLTVRRRRFWARITTDNDGRTIVALGGLARTDRSGWGKEFDRMRESIKDELARSEPAARMHEG